ncbi:MAG: energy-coupling factor transporter transmembrane component T [Ardenticatenia bacterium]|nr:energy-coupling factor transporter transmembrane component T [Ardenticatenia bacterium]
MPPTLFVPGEGLLYRWHPLTKITLAVAALVLTLVPWGRRPAWLAIPLAITVGFGLMMAAHGRGPALAWAKRLLWLVAPVFLSLILVHGLFYPGGRTPVWQVGPLTFTQEGLLFAATVGGRLLLAVGAFMVVLTTTHPADLTTALVNIGLSPEGAYLILAAIHLLPRMQARAQAIVAAQHARGLRTDGPPWQRARALLPLTIPLVLGAIQDVEERAMALEARAFRSSRPKTSLRVLRDSPAQRAFRRGLLLLSGAVTLLARLTA